MSDGISPLPDATGPAPVSASIPPPSMAPAQPEAHARWGLPGRKRDDAPTPAAEPVLVHTPAAVPDPLPAPTLTLSEPEPEWEMAPPPPSQPLVALPPESHEGPAAPPPAPAPPAVAEVAPAPPVAAPPPPPPAPEPPAVVPEIDPMTGAELPIARSPAEMLIAAGVLPPPAPAPAPAMPAPVAAVAPVREPDVPEGLPGVRTPAQILQQIQRGEAAAGAVQAQLAAEETSSAERSHAA